MDHLLLKAKVVALSIHVFCSLLLVLLGLGFLSSWYPSWLFRSDGGLQVFWLLLGVDLVIGPLLTFVLYNLAKSIKERCVDVSLVVLLQLGAFGYGMYQAWQQRPLALVYVDATVVSCSHQWFEWANIKPPHQPDVLALLALTPTPTPDQLSRRVMISFAAGVGECVLTDQYVPTTQIQLDWVQARAGLLKQLPADIQHTILPNQLLVPFEGRYQSVILVLDDQMKVVDSHPSFTAAPHKVTGLKRS
jgi:hypothetical protein